MNLYIVNVTRTTVKKFAVEAADTSDAIIAATTHPSNTVGYAACLSITHRAPETEVQELEIRERDEA